MYGETNMETYITICKTDSCTTQGTQQGLCNLEGYDGEGDGPEAQWGGDICIPMTDSC